MDYEYPVTVNWSMDPTSIKFYSTPKMNIVNLAAEITIDGTLVRNSSPNTIDMTIKSQLANKIAEQLISEDLIQLLVSKDIGTDNITAKTSVKVIQE